MTLIAINVLLDPDAATVERAGTPLPGSGS
jgi:hypothetical protein